MRWKGAFDDMRSNEKVKQFKVRQILNVVRRHEMEKMI